MNIEWEPTPEPKTPWHIWVLSILVVLGCVVAAFAH